MLFIVLMMFVIAIVIFLTDLNIILTVLIMFLIVLMIFFSVMVSEFMVMITIHKDISRLYDENPKYDNCSVYVIADEQEFYEKLEQIANLVVN